ncbi:hypothetical protein [Microvirga zambiensis]|uniref:hypothetical protein n=1 Tax=Microvirga zambiensis TaxID=1402137 RepID=UPI0031B5E091
MKATVMPAILVAVALLVLGLVPYLGSSYHLAVAIGILSQLVLATAWALFSGTTRYVSLATVAFFGIGAYTVAVYSGRCCPGPWCFLRRPGSVLPSRCWSACRPCGCRASIS